MDGTSAIECRIIRLKVQKWDIVYPQCANITLRKRGLFYC